MNLAKEPGNVDRLGVLVVTSGVERCLLITGHRVRRQCDDGDLTAADVGFQLAGGLETVDAWEPDVHENDVERLTAGYRQGLVTVRGHQDLDRGVVRGRARSGSGTG